jgi:hypothetical protein
MGMRQPAAKDEAVAAQNTDPPPPQQWWRGGSQRAECADQQHLLHGTSRHLSQRLLLRSLPMDWIRERNCGGGGG